MITSLLDSRKLNSIIPPLESLPQNRAEILSGIEQSIAYMKRNLDQPLQVSRLAQLANISSSHYFALFKRLTGYTPIDFFIRLRMQRACQLLDGTSLSVKQIASALGYEDPFYFSRLFKSVNHIAPSEYREMSRQSKDGQFISRFDVESLCNYMPA